MVICILNSSVAAVALYAENAFNAYINYCVKRPFGGEFAVVQS